METKGVVGVNSNVQGLGDVYQRALDVTERLTAPPGTSRMRKTVRRSSAPAEDFSAQMENSAFPKPSAVMGKMTVGMAPMRATASQLRQNIFKSIRTDGFYRHFDAL